MKLNSPSVNSSVVIARDKRVDITSQAGGRGRSDDISRSEERSEQSVDTSLVGTSEHGFVQPSPATAAGAVCHGKSTYFLTHGLCPRQSTGVVGFS